MEKCVFSILLLVDILLSFFWVRPVSLCRPHWSESNTAVLLQSQWNHFQFTGNRFQTFTQSTVRMSVGFYSCAWFLWLWFFFLFDWQVRLWKPLPWKPSLGNVLLWVSCRLAPAAPPLHPAFTETSQILKCRISIFLIVAHASHLAIKRKEILAVWESAS